MLKNKKKFPTALFITASLASLALLPVFFRAFQSALSSSGSDNQTYVIAGSRQPADSDPLITKVPGPKDAIKAPVVTQNDPSLGPADAPVSLVIFSDFQCDYCQKQETVLKQLQEQYGDKIRIVWKDYPENDLNSVSFKASLAGRCAQEQGKFWPYHDLLYRAKDLRPDRFSALAAGLGMDQARFERCLSDNDGRNRNKIMNDILEADALDITGVPFIYVNDQELMGQTSLQELKDLIDKELTK